MSTGKKLLFSLIPAALLWGGLELGVSALFSDELSAWDAPPPEEGGQTPTMPGNPYLLYEYRPGKHIQASSVVTINSLGLRGEEPDMPKPGNMRRLMTTGDSSIFGFGVADDEVFSEVAAAQLGEGVEAINAATPGYSTFQTINLLRLRALETEPDLLVIGNLWSDNNFDAFVDKELLASYEGYATSVVGRTRALLGASAVFRLLDYRLRVRPAAERVGFGDTERIFGQGEHIGLRRVAINDYAANLEQLIDLAGSVGAETLFVLPANQEDLDTGGDGNMKAWDPYRKVMREIAARNGAPVIDVPELFQATGKGKEDLFIDEMHPSTEGHKLMGDALAAVLSEARWAEGGTVMHSGTGGPIPTYEDPFVDGTDTSQLRGDSDPNGSVSNNPNPHSEKPPGDPNGSPGDPNGNPGPPGGDPGPNPGGGVPGGGPSIKGTLSFSSYSQGVIQIDAFSAEDIGATPNVLGTAKLQQPGAFKIEYGGAKEIVFRVYLDENNNGPDAADRLIEMYKSVIDVEDAVENGLNVDLDAERISTGS